MTTLQIRIIRCAALFGFATAAFAQTTSIQLPRDNPISQIKAGTGDDLVRQHCALCHSTDYIVRQPRLDAQHWDAEVKKMVTVFGARISDADVKIIADYLARNYSSEGDSQPRGVRRQDP